MWSISIVILVASIIKRKEQTIQSFKKSKVMMSSMMPKIVVILFVIGLVMALIPEEIIRGLADQNVLVSTVGAALVGAVTIIPAFVAFPLVGSLIDSGASIVIGVSFLTTLTMVGVATFPLEKEQFGLKFALVRNGLSFVFAVVIALVMGVLI
jgi:uncharacterized membrane protein YraQ (UPF0718 family)